MPEMRKGVAFLYSDEHDANNDSNFLAMGFIIAELSPIKNFCFSYLATNEHVIRNHHEICVRVNTLSGGFTIATFAASRFVIDKEFDIAVAPFPVQSEMDIYFVNLEELIDDWRGDDNKLKIGPGDELVMISRIIGLKTRYKTKNLPVLRFGNVSLCPECEEKFFIAEMRSVAGHSGSPVFVYNHPSPVGLRPSGLELTGMLGMNRGHLPNYDPVMKAEDVLQGRRDQRPTHVVATNMSMSQIIPAWKIKELLRCKRIREEYEKAEDAASNSLIDSPG
jgi:hypothetical protein